MAPLAAFVKPRGLEIFRLAWPNIDPLTLIYLKAGHFHPSQHARVRAPEQAWAAEGDLDS